MNNLNNIDIDYENEKKQIIIIEQILAKDKYDIYYNNIIDENDNDDKKNPDFLMKKLEKIKKIGPIKKYQIWKKLLSHICSSRYSVLSTEQKYFKILLDILDEKFILKKIEYNKFLNNLEYYNLEDNNIKQIYVELCKRSGIYDNIHLSKLIRINFNNRIKNFDKYISNYLESPSIEQKNKSLYNDEFIISEILMLLSDNDIINSIFNNDDLILKFINKFKNRKFLDLFYNLTEFYDFTSIFKINKKDQDILLLTYLDTSTKIYNMYIDNIKKNKDEDDDEYLYVYKQIFKIKNMKYKKEYKMINDNLKIFENKLKEKLPYLYSTSYYYIDMQSYYKVIDNTQNKDSKKVMKTSNKEVCDFITYMLEIYKNSHELINQNNIDNFTSLKYFDKFIDLQNIENKNLIRTIINQKIYDGFGQHINLKLLSEIGFDNITLKNAMYSRDYNILKFLLDNKYNASSNDLLYIYQSFINYNNSKQEIPYDIEEILNLYISYNIFMDKDILTQFIKNNDFPINYNFNIFKKFTIYKDIDDKEFNSIIIEILEKTKYKNENTYMPYTNIDIHDVRSYVDNLTKNNKKLSIGDIYKFANHNVKFLLDIYVNQ